MGEAAGGLITSQNAVLDGVLGITCWRSEQVVMREVGEGQMLRRDDPFERFSDTKVCTRAPSSGQFVVQRLADERVREAVAVRHAGHLDQEARTARVVERVEERWLGDLAEGRQQTRREVASNDGRP